MPYKSKGLYPQGTEEHINSFSALESLTIVGSLHEYGLSDAEMEKIMKAVEEVTDFLVAK